MRLDRRSLVVLALLGACGSGEPAATTAEPPPPSSATPPPPPPTSAPATPTPPPSSGVVDGVMHTHFHRAIDAQDALIRGDIEDARSAMAFLATNDEHTSIPDPLLPYLAEFQTEAGHFAEASTLSEAGTVFARTLQRCGHCHTESHGGPRIAATPIPDGDTPAARMRRHQWAADRMFDGLVTADAATFREGNEALTSAPLTQNELPDTAPQPPEQVVSLTENVRSLGAQAATANDDETRATIYGHYLATCGACHRILTGGAPPTLRLEGAVHEANEQAEQAPQ